MALQEENEQLTQTVQRLTSEASTLYADNEAAVDELAEAELRLEEAEAVRRRNLALRKANRELNSAVERLTELFGRFVCSLPPEG